MLLRRLTLIIGLMALLSFQGSDVSASSPVERPNILLVVADDLGWNDVDFYWPCQGEPWCDDVRESPFATPNLRRYALNGTRFSHHYVYPFCSPTRGALMTGRYPSRYGLQNTVIDKREAYSVPRSERFLPEYLREAGYRTNMVGKWHLGFHTRWALPHHRGFDYFSGFLNGGADHFKHTHAGIVDWWVDNESRESLAATAPYSAEAYTDQAIDYVRDSSNNSSERPWFLYMAYSMVHAKFQVPDHYIREACAAGGDCARLNKTKIGKMGGMVLALDTGFGRLMEHIDLDKTLVVFLSDNGNLNCCGGSNRPLHGQKSTAKEGGVRVAAFAVGAGVRQRHVVTEPVSIVDWLPTFLEAAGHDAHAKAAGDTNNWSKPLDGMSIWRSITTTAAPRSFDLAKYTQALRTRPLLLSAASCGHRSHFIGTEGSSVPWAAVLVRSADASIIKATFACLPDPAAGLDKYEHRFRRLYNLTATASEKHSLAIASPLLRQKALETAALLNAGSVPPYVSDPACPPKNLSDIEHWLPWCDSEESVLGEWAVSTAPSSDSTTATTTPTTPLTTRAMTSSGARTTATASFSRVDPQMTSAAVAGIVVGSIAFLAMACSIVAYFVKPCQTRTTVYSSLKYVQDTDELDQEEEVNTVVASRSDAEAEE